MPRTTRQSLPAPSSKPYTRHRPSNAWTPEEDDIIIQARALGMSWRDMAPRYFGDRKSDNACRKRHERLMDKRKSQEWDSKKLDQLAAEYVAMREQIWMPLATRMGESWGLIEAKCMENGHKNLISRAQGSDRKMEEVSEQRLPSVEEALQEPISHSMGKRRQTIASFDEMSASSGSQVTLPTMSQPLRSMASQPMALQPIASQPMRSQHQHSYSTPQSGYYPDPRGLPPLAPTPMAYPTHSYYAAQQPAQYTHQSHQYVPQYALHYAPRREHPPTSIASLLSPVTTTSQ